jgi:hypothetical protein
MNFYDYRNSYSTKRPPLSPAERRLAERRRELGNIEGRDAHVLEQQARKRDWLR